MNNLVAKVREVMAGEDSDAIIKQTNELSQLIQKVGASMYQQPGGGDQGTGPTGETGPTGGAGPTGESGGPSSGDDDVVEGEFKNV